MPAYTGSAEIQIADRTGRICVQGGESESVKAEIRCVQEVNKVVDTAPGTGSGDDVRITSCSVRSYYTSNPDACQR